MFVVMISPEERQRKPYALPVQSIPYTGLTENQSRGIVSKVLKEMHDRGMETTGKLFPYAIFPASLYIPLPIQDLYPTVNLIACE